jgi:cytochrome P450
MLASQNDPAHKRARLLVNEPFSPGRVMDFTRMLRENVNSEIDGFIREGHADFAKIIADPVPAILTAISWACQRNMGPNSPPGAWALSHESISDPKAAMPKIKQMYAYFEAVIEERRRNPGQNLLSRIVHSRIDGDQLRDDELLGFCTVLLLGGIDNWTKLIATALWRLAWDFPLRYRLMRDRQIIPPRLMNFCGTTLRLRSGA